MTYNHLQQQKDASGQINPAHGWARGSAAAGLVESQAAHFGTLSTFLGEADANEWNITLNTTLAIHFPHRNHGARHDIRLTCLCVMLRN